MFPNYKYVVQSGEIKKIENGYLIEISYKSELPIKEADNDYDWTTKEFFRDTLEKAVEKLKEAFLAE